MENNELQKNELQKNEIHIQPPDMARLSNELVYQKFLFNKDQVRRFFRELSMAEYIALHIIQKTEEDADIYSGRTYLKELSEKMQLPIRQISKIVGALKERGLLSWAHDGDGSEGTYVTLTNSGRSLLGKEEAELKNYYGKVIGKFGTDNLIQLLQLMKQLETIMSAELEGMEAVAIDE